MKVVQLQYPDQTPDSKILDDLTILSRASGPKGLRGVAALGSSLSGLTTKCQQRQIPLGAPTTGPLPANQAVVTNGAAIQITGGDVTLTVSNNVITGGTFTPD
jgi:hypothetical protein